jgi:hypothetical protein
MPFIVDGAYPAYVANTGGYSGIVGAVYVVDNPPPPPPPPIAPQQDSGGYFDIWTGARKKDLKKGIPTEKLQEVALKKAFELVKYSDKENKLGKIERRDQLSLQIDLIMAEMDRRKAMAANFRLYRLFAAALLCN